MHLPKPKPTKKSPPGQAAVSFFFKGFPPDVRYRRHSVPQSLDLARGTLYETWFRALQLSPYYSAMCADAAPPSAAAARTLELFGDVRALDFGQWWVERGYGLFAEQRPFNRVQLIQGSSAHGSTTPVLQLEIPLDVSPKTLLKQFESLLAVHHPHFRDFDRWQASTARATLNNRKLTSVSLNLYLEVYRLFLTRHASDEQSRLYDIGVELKLNPQLIVQGRLDAQAAEKRIKLASAVSECLEKAKNLVAHASEGIFPCVDNHPWITRKTRSARKSAPD